VDEAGRWTVNARIRLKPTDTPMRLTPAVSFVGESGDRTAVAWEGLETATPGCVAEGDTLVLPAGIREVRLTGRTDPRSHPIPATASCIAVDIRRSQPIREARS
jgi:RNA polymerase primary sigma factor